MLPLVCEVQSQTRGEDVDCDEGNDHYNRICNKDDCDINSFYMGE